MKITTSQKIEKIAKDLQLLGVFLSGSFALFYQGIDLERDAHDVDFVTSDNVELTDDISKAIVAIFIENGASADDLAVEEGNYDNSLFVMGCNFPEFFLEIRLASDIKTVVIDDIEMQDCKQIIEKKLEYACSESKTAIKHQFDLEKIGIDVTGYIKAKEDFEKAKSFFTDKKHEKSKVLSRLSGMQHNFKFECLQAGQQKPYQDSVYYYKIYSDLDAEKVLELARKHISKLGDTTNKGSCFSGSCNFPFGLETYYSFAKVKNNEFDLKICHPYTG